MEGLWDHGHRWGSQEAIGISTGTETSLSADANQVLGATLPPVGSLKNWLSKVCRKGQSNRNQLCAHFDTSAIKHI